jgi:hypothetical protein
MRGGFGERLGIGFIVALAMGLAGLIMLIVLPLVGVILSVTMVTVAVLLLALAVALPFVILFGGAGVKGSGFERHEVRDVPPFHEVQIAGTLRTEIVRDNSHSVTVTGDDNLVEHVQTEVSEGVLTIHTASRLRPRAGLNVHVSAPELDAVATSGTTKTSVTGIETNRFRLDTSGVAKTILSGRCRDATMALSGAGKLDARDFDCDNVEIAVSGSGKATVCATSSLAVRISGAGKIECYGNPDTVTKDISGAGRVELK